jgi:DGQHR domain-containing protein
MDKDPLGNLLIDAESIAQAVRLRSKAYIEKTISAKTPELLQEKAALEERDGWEILRQNTKSTRLKQDKKASERLEDFIWVTLARMGFDELSDGRQFCIDMEDGPNPRQIDAFAKDSESVVLVECTTSEQPSKKNMSDLIQKIRSYQQGAAKAIRKHYGSDVKLKVRWCIATHNIEWGQSDLEKAIAASIVVLQESEVNYYSKLTSHLKGAAKYQFLSHLFADEEIKGLELRVPATKGKMGNQTFYNFLMKPADLLKIAYVSRKASRSADDLEAYQRMLKPARLKNIAAYIDSGGHFPTNIVVNMKSKKTIRFDQSEKMGDTSFGVLYLPPRYASCWIIDGQHRLFGYAQSERAEKKTDKTALPVLAYDNLTATQEAKLFVDINCEQVRVAKSLLNELYSNLLWDSQDYAERINALCTRVVMSLDSGGTSPFHSRIIVSNRDRTNYCCLTLTSFNDGLKENKFFGREWQYGPLNASRSNNLDASRQKAVAVLATYFGQIRDGVKSNWQLGDDKGGYLCTNNGVRALLMVLREILNYIATVYAVDLDTLQAEDLVADINTLTAPIVDFFANASPQEIDEFRSRQALKGVRSNSLRMMSLIYKEIVDFLPQCLSEFLDTVDQEGTKEAREIIDEIQGKLFAYTLDVLRRHYKDDWWCDGVPVKVRLECVEVRERDNRQKREEQYLCLINYRDIALNTWEEFQFLFSLGEKGGKPKVTEWLYGVKRRLEIIGNMIRP